ncbi:MAG: Gldg family protein [Myxococcota bacterium]
MAFFGTGASIYLLAMGLLFIAERTLVDSPLQAPLRTGAFAALVIVAVMRVRRVMRAKDEGLKKGHRLSLILFLVGCAAVALYWATTDDFVRGLELTEKGESRYLGSMQSLWPLVWLLGTIPMLAVDAALTGAPVVLPMGRLRASLTHGLIAAMGIGLVFPVNYIAKEKNERWDLAYFKTPAPGTATHKLVEALEQPVTVRIFMPPSSEVAQELRAYFAPLEGSKLSVEILDQAAQPRLAKALSIRDNGTVALTTGDVAVLMKDPKAKDEAPEGEEPEAEEEEPKPVTRRVRVNPEFDKAKRTLAKIDREVQKALIELGQGERIAYLTTGHGEIDWSGQDEQVSIRAFRRALLDLGFKVKGLSLQQGLGEAVPDDASVVMIIGPRRQFHNAEVNALRDYINRGGSLFIAMPAKLSIEGQPPVDDPLDDLLAEMGVRRGDGILAAERNIVAMSHNNNDRYNTLSNSFTSHASSRELANMGKRDVFFTPGAGFLEEVEGRETDVTFTVRSLSMTWADLDLDAEFSADKGEAKEVRNIVAAITGGGDGARYRALVLTSPTALVDLVILRFIANQQFALDGVNWLIGAEDLAGTTESEEDVKIEHTKEGQAGWFYGTVLGVPILVLGLGTLRIGLRRKPTVLPRASAPPAARPEPEPESEPDSEAEPDSESEPDEEPESEPASEEEGR